MTFDKTFGRRLYDTIAVIPADVKAIRELLKERGTEDVKIESARVDDNDSEDWIYGLQILYHDIRNNFEIDVCSSLGVVAFHDHVPVEEVHPTKYVGCFHADLVIEEFLAVKEGRE